jgi:uncharacterized protein (DUF885 family)
MTQDFVPNRLRFEEVMRSYYRVWFRFHPEAAVDAGVTGYAHLLTPYTEDERGALVCLNDELMVGLDELSRYGLSVDQQIDMDILYNAARLENEYLLDGETQRPDPSRYLPINAIHQLLLRPVVDFSANLMARVSAVPMHLEGACTYLKSVASLIPALWVEMAVRSARAGAQFVLDLPQHPKVQAETLHLSGFERALREAAQALNEYADFLESGIAPLAKGDFACGSIYFEHLLRRRHFLDVGIDEVRALGVRLVEETRAALLQECRALGGGDDVAALTRRLNAKHPSQAELLGVYRLQMQAAQAFVLDHDLVSVPTATRLEVMETPVFLRHQIPFAAYCEPVPNDPEQHGYYYVTPPVDHEQLAEHSHAGLMHTCAHEAWPGHHLQFVTANQNPTACTLPRLLNPSATLYEGWALYSEQLMHEQGFLARPESRFLLLRDRLWRALRIVIDVDIHARGLTLEAAADLMVQHLGFPRSQALADLAWYTHAPTVPLSYATGWSIINALRERLRANHPEFDLKRFHDELLSQGSVALPRVVRRLHGESMWSSVKRDLFQGVDDAAT